MNLESIFGSEPPDLSWKIVVPFEADDGRKEVLRALWKRKWNDLSARELMERISCPISEVSSMLTKEGFLYYLPALLRMCDEEPGKVDDLPEAILLRLIRDLGDRAISASDFSQEQADFLIAFFKPMFRFGNFAKYSTQLASALKG